MHSIFPSYRGSYHERNFHLIVQAVRLELLRLCRHRQIQTKKLWVAENRSRVERNQAKIARGNGKLMPIVFVKDDLIIDWKDASDVPVMVQEAMQHFISHMV